MKNPRLRSLLIAGVSLVAIGGVATAWATGSAAVSGRFVTAVAGTGDIAQSYLATGTVSRDNVVEAAFSGSGTVKKVHVAVGDEVAAGDVLASLDTAALKLALLNAETELASAKANLYAAEHPTSGSSGSPRRGTGTSVAAWAANARVMTALEMIPVTATPRPANQATPLPNASRV